MIYRIATEKQQEMHGWSMDGTVMKSSSSKFFLKSTFAHLSLLAAVVTVFAAGLMKLHKKGLNSFLQHNPLLEQSHF